MEGERRAVERNKTNPKKKKKKKSQIRLVFASPSPGGFAMRVWDLILSEPLRLETEELKAPRAAPAAPGSDKNAVSHPKRARGRARTDGERRRESRFHPRPANYSH